MKAVISYIRNRLDERSTWLLIGTGITAAAELPLPWSVVSALIGTIAAFIPDGPVAK